MQIPGPSLRLGGVQNLEKGGNRALTEPEFWRERHLLPMTRVLYPRPSRRLLDFELNSTFRRHLADRRGQKLMEIGCGSSLWLPYFSREFGMQVYGIDYLREGVASAERILETNGVEGTILAADVFDLEPRHQGAYQVVFSLGLVEHFSDPGKPLASFARLLAPGGLLITWVPNTSGWIVAISEKVCKSFRGVYARLDLELLAGLQEELGLEVVEARYTQFLDLTLISVLSLPGIVRGGVATAFRLSNLPLLLLAKHSRLESPRLSAGIITVARALRHGEWSAY